jgi:5-methylcytosine-specific restriction endonuclease McrA
VSTSGRYLVMRNWRLGLLCKYMTNFKPNWMPSKSEHTRSYDSFGRNKQTDKLYHSAKYKAFRKLKLLYEPICERCMQGEPPWRFSEHCHHIIPVDTPEGMRQAYSLTGTMALCAECHNTMRKECNATVKHFSR